MKRENCAKRLKQALELRNMRQAELSQLTGVPKSAVSQYLSGKFEPKQDRLETIAKALNVSEAWLMGYDVSAERTHDTQISSDSVFDYNNVVPMPKMNTIPLLGTIACGEPILAEENFEGEVVIPENIKADFALRCKGDSMVDARINDGDIVYIRKQPNVNNGEIAAVLIENEATLKKVYFENGILTLVPCNNKYRPFTYSGEILNEIIILGKAVGFTSTDI